MLCFGLFHLKEDSETASETGNSPRTYTKRCALLSAGWGRGLLRFVQQLQPMCCPFHCFPNLRLAWLNAPLIVILIIQSAAQRTTWNQKGKVNAGLMQTGMSSKGQSELAAAAGLGSKHWKQGMGCSCLLLGHRPSDGSLLRVTGVQM